MRKTQRRTSRHNKQIIEFAANTERLNKTMKSLFETTTNLNELTTKFKGICLFF